MEMGNLIRSTSSHLGCTASINNPPQHLNKNHLLHGMLSRFAAAAEQLKSSVTSSPLPIEKVFAIKNSKGNDSHNTGRILLSRVTTAVDLKKREVPHLLAKKGPCHFLRHRQNS